MANKKISKVNLSGESYEIDVATNLKATNILSTNKGQTSKVATVGAVQKPDGVNALFDENNKINSSYLSDTILGQLKFGGSLYLTPEDPSGTPNLQLTVNPSAALYGAFQEYLNNLENFDNSWVVMEPGLKLKFQVSTDSGFEQPEWNFCCSYGELSSGHPELTVKFPTSICEGYYFIASTDFSAVYYSPKYGMFSSSYSEEYLTLMLAEAQVGDWQVVSNGKLIKIDNTDTITHIKDSYTSLLSIEGAGLKLKGFTDAGQSIKFDKPLTYEVGSTKLSLGANGVNGLYIGDQSYINSAEVSAPSVKASTKMTAPTITNTADKTQVVNLDYFENNATKVDWENIDSEVHVINDHNVEIDGGLNVNGALIVPAPESEIITEDITSSVEYAMWEPVDYSTPHLWKDPAADQPNFYHFVVKAGYSYSLYTTEEAGGICPKVLFYERVPETSENISPIGILDANTSGFEEIDSWPRGFGADSAAFNGIRFTSPYTGRAYVSCGSCPVTAFTSILAVCNIPTESVQINKNLTVTGDLEITGDLSFGADSHIVFGTIEGTDFIADYAKVKNAPVEADDVVNKAYFDANKGSSEGGCVETVAVKASEGLVYELTGDEYSCTGIGTCTDTDIVIAAVHNGLPVTSIGSDVFELCDSLTSIVIPDSVTSIGSGAFYECSSLTSVVLPDSVTDIGEYAFTSCENIKSIVIPAGVTSIGDYAFHLCKSLTSIVIPDSVTSIGYSAFGYCPSLTIYCEADSKPEGWHEDWNPSNRPVVWGAALSIPAINDKLNNGGGLPSGATEGAFLRYKSGAAVWEVIPNAEDSAF